jgi:hypothetical protein
MPRGGGGTPTHSFLPGITPEELARLYQEQLEAIASATVNNKSIACPKFNSDSDEWLAFKVKFEAWADFKGYLSLLEARRKRSR